MRFNEKIKQLRIDNNMTQEDLAKICFVSRNAVSKWENDKGYPNLDSLKILSKHFDIPIDKLLNNEDICIISVKNNEKQKQVILNITLFIIYVLIGILIPYFLFIIDPTSVMAYTIFIGPISFGLLGFIIGLIYKNTTNVVLTGLISTIPLLLYFETTQVRFGIYELIYYLIFLGIYFITYYFKKKFSKSYN